MRYRLWVNGDRTSEWVDEDDDGRAMLGAIGCILRRAHRDPSGRWARGLVELREEDPEHRYAKGRLVATMPAKV